MNKIVKLGLTVLSTLTLTGCFAGVSNSVNKTGGFFGSYPSDYIIINTTGDKILDIYKLRNTYVSDKSYSDGVYFKHPENESHILIQGNVKIIRNPTSRIWDSYEEYHADVLFVEELRNNKK